MSSRTILFLCELAVAASAAAAARRTAPFQSRPITPTGEYTFNIEGPAVDRQGNLYVVNFQKPGTIGKLPNGRFAIGAVRRAARGQRRQRDPFRPRRAHVRRRLQEAQYLSRSSADGKAVETYFHSDDFNQPNDLTVAADGTIYASDPNWKRHDGQIWRVREAPDGTSSAR